MVDLVGLRGEGAGPTSVLKMGSERRCVKCGRVVGLYRTPDGVFTMAHRETAPHTSETPWCVGGGRKVRRV